MAVDYTEWDKILAAMGAKHDTRKLQLDPSKKRDKVKIVLKRGVEIKAADFENIPTIAGMFSHLGEHALLYIDEPHHSRDELLEQPALNAQKFHLVKHCSVLQNMHKKQKSDRYVLIQNATGTFPSKPKDPMTGKWDTENPVDAKLMPCKICLGELAYGGYMPDKLPLKPAQRQQNHKIYMGFEVKKFFEHYEPLFFDTKYYRENPNDGKANYTIDQAKQRDKFLTRTDYTCQGDDCGVRLRDKPGWLHLHHINSRRGDYAEKNLKLLCIICHSLQSNHQHMRPLIKPAVAIEIRQRLSKQKRKNQDEKT